MGKFVEVFSWGSDYRMLHTSDGGVVQARPGESLDDAEKRYQEGKRIAQAVNVLKETKKRKVNPKDAARVRKMFDAARRVG